MKFVEAGFIILLLATCEAICGKATLDTIISNSIAVATVYVWQKIDIFRVYSK